MLTRDSGSRRDGMRGSGGSRSWLFAFLECQYFQGSDAPRLGQRPGWKERLGARASPLGAATWAQGDWPLPLNFDASPQQRTLPAGILEGGKCLREFLF